MRHRFPIPLVHEHIDELFQANFFSNLDIKSGFHLIRMYQGDEYKTVIQTHHGQYEFKVMLFGFRPHLRPFILVFFDDILAYIKEWFDHLLHLEATFTILATNQLLVKEKKCTFGCSSIRYLGHVISDQGVSMHLGKVKAVLD